MKFVFKTISVPEEKKPVPETDAVGFTAVDCAIHHADISKDFLFAGRATFVATNAQGETHTFRNGSNRSEFPVGSGKFHTTYFLNIKAPGGRRWPNGSVSPWRYIGIISEVTGKIKLTAKSEYQGNEPVYKIAQWTIARIFDKESLPPGYTITHAGKCGKCGKVIPDSDTESHLQRGFDAVCFKELNPETEK